MTKLSVNINKIATIRNARGGNRPNVVEAAKACEKYGAEGITIHPRPDERHITTHDVYDLAEIVTTEFNIEGYPDERFLKFIEDVRPAQATLVPDGPDVITSNAGWDTVKNFSFLYEIIEQIQEMGVRTSIFLDPDPAMVEGAQKTGTDRIELYTERFAKDYHENPEESVAAYAQAAALAKELGLEINAGHDLDLSNLEYFVHHVPHVSEVSIGHALICDALYYGLENTIGMYLRKLSNHL